MINLKKLLTETKQTKKALLMESADHVRSGLEKVFGSGDREISYRRCENVGLGYIKSISEAFKVAMTESRKVAKNFGYRDDESQCKFIKEEQDFSNLDAQSPESSMAKMSPEEMPHDETDMSNPEERKEVDIANELIDIAARNGAGGATGTNSNAWDKVIELGKELKAMHGQK